MITEWIITVFLASIDALFSLFPSFTVPTFDSPTGAFAKIGTLNKLFPVTTLILCILAAVTIMVALYLWDAILFIYHQFWGSS